MSNEVYKFDSHHTVILINLCSKVKGAITNIIRDAEHLEKRAYYRISENIEQGIVSLINSSSLTSEDRFKLLNSAIQLGLTIPKCLVFPEEASWLDHPDCTEEIAEFISRREVETVLKQ